jgi:glycoprotein 2-beta-D-xylosyltransferase
MAYDGRSPWRMSAASPSPALPSLMRLLVAAIVLLGLCSISLQGYGVLKQRTLGAIQAQADGVQLDRETGAASLLRKTLAEANAEDDTHQSPRREEDPHASITAIAGEEEVEPTLPPPDVCADERDWGLVTKIQESAKVYCANAEAPHAASHVTVYNVARGGFKAVLFQRQFALDLRGAKLHKPIKSIAQDGGRHDPRFIFQPKIVQCDCEELHQYAVDELLIRNRTLELWDRSFAKIKKHTDPPATVCAKGSVHADDGPHVDIKDKTLLIVRKDDHNPFFQISNALNAWILMHALEWKPEEVRVIHLDGGYPSPIDELHRKLLSPTYPIQKAIPEELYGHRLEFHNDVALVPYEVTGPMMQHLNDYEPCHDSKMLQQFRQEALRVMELPALPLIRTQITVTVITRRDYDGRKVQRTWRNEAQVLDKMREQYATHAGLPIVFQSIEFVSLSLQAQMSTMLTSDVVIGMHGAGMVNVMWTRPGTVVVEIFPKKRFRWGYRNLCQFLGCDWHQFRGGKDTGKGDNNSHKLIPWEEWTEFFGPLLDKVLANVASERR